MERTDLAQGELRKIVESVLEAGDGIFRIHALPQTQSLLVGLCMLDELVALASMGRLASSWEPDQVLDSFPTATQHRLLSYAGQSCSVERIISSLESSIGKHELFGLTCVPLVIVPSPGMRKVAPPSVQRIVTPAGAALLGLALSGQSWSDGSVGKWPQAYHARLVQSWAEAAE